MKQSQLRYITIVFNAQRELNISTTEYIVAAIIYNLSANPKSRFPGWCYASKQYIADTIGIGKVTVTTTIDKLLKRGLLEKHETTKYLKTADLWYNTVILDRSEIDLVGQELTSSQVNNRPPSRSEIDPNNNINKNINNNIYSALSKENTVQAWSKEDFTAYRNQLLFDDQTAAHIRLIAEYWTWRLTYIPTKQEADREIKRNVKVASLLVKFPKEQVDKVVSYLQDFADFAWTLETVYKYINRDIDNLIKIAEEKAERRKQYATS
jgi:hypothetical protein